MADRPKPSEIPYLHVREGTGSLFPLGFEVVGNARALLQLRRQIDRALAGRDGSPLEESIYRELHGEEYEVSVRRARSEGEMAPQKPPQRWLVREQERVPEAKPWAHRARAAVEEQREREGG